MKSITLLVFCLVLLVSCKITKKEGNGQGEDGTCLYEIIMANSPCPQLKYGYVVNGVIVGKDKKSLQDYLAHQKKGRVIFVSDFKLTMEIIANIEDSFVKQGFKVEQFWIPSPFSSDPNSQYPGCVNLTKEYREERKSWRQPLLPETMADGTYLYEIVKAYQPSSHLNDGYVVNGVLVGKDKDSLHDYLVHKEKGKVIFVADHKWGREELVEFETLFTELGFQLEEFWVQRSASHDPDSPYLGGINLLKKTCVDENSD